MLEHMNSSLKMTVFQIKRLRLIQGMWIAYLWSKHKYYLLPDLMHQNLALDICSNSLVFSWSLSVTTIHPWHWKHICVSDVCRKRASLPWEINSPRTEGQKKRSREQNIQKVMNREIFCRDRKWIGRLKVEKVVAWCKKSGMLYNTSGATWKKPNISVIFWSKGIHWTPNSLKSDELVLQRGGENREVGLLA